MYGNCIFLFGNGTLIFLIEYGNLHSENQLEGYLLKLSSIKKSGKSVYLNTGFKSNLVAVIPCEGYGGFFVFKILSCFAEVKQKFSIFARLFANSILPEIWKR